MRQYRRSALGVLLRTTRAATESTERPVIVDRGLAPVAYRGPAANERCLVSHHWAIPHSQSASAHCATASPARRPPTANTVGASDFVSTAAAAAGCHHLPLPLAATCLASRSAVLLALISPPRRPPPSSPSQPPSSSPSAKLSHFSDYLPR